jgi:heptosyltransferase-2
MEIKKIIIRGPNWIGDHVMALPFYRAVKKKYPAAKIDLIIDQVPSSLVLEENLFSEIIPLKKSQRKFPGLFKTAFDIRKYSWDLGFNLPDSFSSRLLFHFLPISKKTFHKNWQGVHSLKHKSQLYLDLLNE